MRITPPGEMSHLIIVKVYVHVRLTEIKIDPSIDG